MLNGNGKTFDPDDLGGTVLAFPVDREFAVITRLGKTWRVKANAKLAWKKDESPPHTYWDLPATPQSPA